MFTRFMDFILEAIAKVAGPNDKGYAMICPAHEERTPSMLVKSGKGKCLSCGHEMEVPDEQR